MDEFSAWLMESFGNSRAWTPCRATRVATIESIGSSTRIEGSKLFDNEVEKLFPNLH